MNPHKHARVTYARLLEMVQETMSEGLSTAQVSARQV